MLVRATATVSNGKLVTTNTGTTDFRVRHNLLLGVNKYYVATKMRETHSSSIRYFIGSTTGALFSNTRLFDSSTSSFDSSIFISTDNGYLTFQAGLTGTSVVGELMEFDYIYNFNISTLIANKQYSPLYNTTFDLMTDAQIKTQMDQWLSTYGGDLTNKQLVDNTYDSYFNTGFVDKTSERDFIDYLGYFFWLTIPIVTMYLTIKGVKTIL